MCRLIAALAFAALFLPPPAGAAEIDHERQYRACMVLVQRDPEAAFESALTWRDLGGGDAARHCLAAALMALEHYAEAARRLQELAQEIMAEPAMKADLLGHAGQAWLLDGRPDQAYAVLTAALELKPDDVDLLVDRAAALAEGGAYADAVGDLDRALALDGNRVDALVFRASARRLSDDLAAAEADVERALVLNARHVEGLLERGIIRRLKGDDDGARKDWMAVLDAAPGTAAADAARTNLQKMELKTDHE